MILYFCLILQTPHRSTLFPYTTLFRSKMRLKKRLLAFSRRLHARIRKTRYMHKMRCLLINRRSLLLAYSGVKSPTECQQRSEERFSRNAETDLVCRLLLEKKKKYYNAL